MLWTPDIEITCEDCMDLMARYPDKHFDLAVVDPPYGIKEHGQRPNRKDRWNCPPQKMKYKKIHWDNSAPNKKFFTEIMRVSNNQIIWGANHFISKMPFDSSCWVVWDKKTAGNFADCELAWASFDTSVRKFEWLWSGFRKEKPEQRIHPTQKPVKLYEWIFKNYAEQGQTILDTHLGSGSIAIAAHNYGMKLTGCELDREYYNAAYRRFKTVTSQAKLF